MNNLLTHKTCSDCNGEGDICVSCEGDCYEGPNRLCEYAGDGGHDREVCNGTGKVPIYYTPAEYKESTGKDWPNDAPVWSFDPNMKRQCWSALVTHSESRSMPSYAVVIANEAGKPPSDYRTEEI